MGDRQAFYQMSTDSGYVTVQMPFSLSPDDAEDVIRNFELIIRHVKRRAGGVANPVPRSSRVISSACNSGMHDGCPVNESGWDCGCECHGPLPKG